ncbi:MAG: hypothetical protein PHV93_04480 [Candidatus Pacebacteria bacterium]|nr:hypothetical protein [Candidatus Paceibacterota bacterium]
MGKKTNDSPKRLLNFGFSYNCVFAAVFFLSLFCLLVAIGLSFIASPNEMQKDLFKYLCVGWQSGFGAILGLIGGKIIN